MVDAPDSLADLLVFGFVNFEQPAEYPQATAEGILPQTDTFATELEDGYRITPLNQEDLESARLNGTIEAEIVGMSAEVGMTSSLSDFARAWSNPHMEEVLSTTLSFAVGKEDGDLDCFVDRRCETYGFDAHREVDLTIFGTATQDFRREFRWTSLESGTPVLTVRETIPTETTMTSPVLVIHQEYVYTMLFDDDGTQRLDAYWIDAEVIGADIPDSFALDFAVKGMKKAAEDVDLWVDQNPS